MRIVIIGGGFAGLSAHKVHDSLIIDEKDYFTLTHKLVDVFKTGNPKVAKLPYNGKVMRGRVRSIDFRRKKIILENSVVDYDKLLIATGYSQKIIPNTFKMETVDDAMQLHGRVTSVKRVAILGGGLLGVELASVAREMGKEVYLIEANDRLLNFMSQDSSKFAKSKLEEMGVHVLLKEKIDGIEGKKIKTNDMELESDLVISSIGFKGPSLIQELGMTNINGRMVTDELLRSVDYDDVYGAGDSATTKKFIPMSAQVAVQAGRTAMKNMLGENEVFNYKQYAVICKVNGEYFGDLMGRFVKGRLAELAERTGIAKAVMLLS